MLKTLLFATTLLFGLSTTTVSIDTDASQVGWKGYKVAGSHEGTISVADGNLEITDGALTGGFVTIDMTSIVCTDLKDKTAAKLIGHLVSDDFFGSETYPTSRLNITKVASRGVAGEYRVTADLTIKETTKEIKFNTVLNEEDGKYVATADVKIDRTDFDVRYGSGSFFASLGDKTIYDEFDLSIKLVSK